MHFRRIHFWKMMDSRLIGIRIFNGYFYYFVLGKQIFLRGMHFVKQNQKRVMKLKGYFQGAKRTYIQYENNWIDNTQQFVL